MAGDVRSPPSTGNVDASVLPPAVGARTTAFLPSRIASPGRILHGAQGRPPQASDDRLLEPRRKAREGRHSPLQLRFCVAYVIVGLGLVFDGPFPRRRPRLLWRQALRVHGEGVVLGGVVFLVLINHVENRHVRPEKLPGHDADVAAKALRHVGDEPVDELVRDELLDTPTGPAGVDVTQSKGDIAQPCGVERQELQLRLPDVDERTLLLEPKTVV